MSLTRKDALFSLLFFLLVGGVFLCVFFLVSRVESLRETEKHLHSRSLQLEQQTAERMRQIGVYKKAIADLERYQFEIPENEVDFYSWIQRELTRNGVRSNVVKPTNSPPGRSAVQVDFQGSYYAFIRTLADWRTLKVVLRLASVTMNAADGDNVKGVAIVESVLK